MRFNVLMIGDVVGAPGRQAVCRLLPDLISQHALDFVVANAENICEGSGITPALFDKLRSAGVDVCTMGDHAFRRRESHELYQRSDRLLRPVNLPESAVGRGTVVVPSRSGVAVAVAAVMGQLYMKPIPDSPWQWVDRRLDTVMAGAAVRLIDFHAELTAEKVAFGRHLDGRVSAVVGTHTHIPTADECLLPGGTAYVTDLGMTGPYDSVLGRRVDRVIKTYLTGMPQTLDVATGDGRLSGVLIGIDSETGRATRIERIHVRDG